MKQIALLVHAHTEGSLLIPSLRSAIQAQAFAAKSGVEVELILTLDRPSIETIRIADFEEFKGYFTNLNVDFGDIGLSRNHAVQHSQSDFICFLDGDDLISESWPIEAFKFYNQEVSRKVILHPELSLFFGKKNPYILRHINSNSKDFSPSSLADANFWTALSFGKRVTYLEFEYGKTELEKGLGFEDWHWNCEVLAKGIEHVAVPNTIHFIRRKSDASLVEKTSASFAQIRPTRLFRLENRDLLRRFGLKKSADLKHVLKIKILKFKKIFATVKAIVKLTQKLMPPNAPDWARAQTKQAAKLESLLESIDWKMVPMVTPEVRGIGNAFALTLNSNRMQNDEVWILDRNVPMLKPNIYLISRRTAALADTQSGICLEKVAPNFAHDDEAYMHFLAFYLVQSQTTEFSITDSVTHRKFVALYENLLSSNFRLRWLN